MLSRRFPSRALASPAPATEPSDSLPSSRRRCALYLSAVVVALFLLRVLGDRWRTHFPPQFPDALNPGRSDTYYAVASLTPFNLNFYWAPRPVLYPAFLWLFKRNSHLVVLAQMSAYCASFAVLCVTARDLLRTRLVARATVVLLVLVAAQGRFALWNTQVLSESLGLSLGIVMIATWWRVAARPSPRTLTWAWAWTIAWLLERDAHTLPVALVVVPVAVAFALLTRNLDIHVRRRLLAGSAIALLVCGYVYSAQRVSRRTQYSLANDIGIRVLPDPALRAWFVQGGMPLDGALVGRRGKSAFDDNRFFVEDPSLSRFRRWADGPGSRRMALSLVVRSPDWYRMLRKQSSSILATNYDGYDGYGVLDRLPRP